jgi:DNA-directed RNA polymerase specialized sigma24 family protein
MSGSITQYIQQLQGGSPEAAQLLWEHYFGRLVHVARQMLQDTPRGMADEEDVALEALHSLCRGVQHGRFPELCDRQSLWRLLMVITWRKALDRQEHEHCQKRGGGRVRCEADLLGRSGSGNLDRAVSPEPTPELAALVADQCRLLLDALGEDVLRTVAQRKLEGYTNVEVARQLGCSVASVERKLRRIRGIWEEEAAP